MFKFEEIFIVNQRYFIRYQILVWLHMHLYVKRRNHLVYKISQGIQHIHDLEEYHIFFFQG